MDSLTKTAADMLTYEEIEQMIKVCRTSRDRALIATLYEGAFRIGEVESLSWGDLLFDDKGIVVNVNFKTQKPRYVRMVIARDYLARWKNDYPEQPVPPGSQVFITKQNSEGNYQSLSRQIKRISKRAEIPHKITAHTFRHSRITHLIQEGVGESIIKMMVWGNISTDMFKTYAHLTNDDIDRGILEISGMSQAPIKKPRNLKPRQCDKCHALNSITQNYCGVCGNPLTEELQQDYDDKIHIAREQQEYQERLDSLKTYDSKMEEMDKKLKEMEDLKKELEQLKEQKVSETRNNKTD